MANLWFSIASDIHLVVGQRADVGLFLEKRPMSAEVAFRPLFDPIEESEYSITNFRISVDPSSGTVSTSAEAEGIPEVANFILLAEEVGGPGKAAIRIHIHNGVNRLILAPDPLTVPLGSNNYHMFVWVQYSDGVYADISQPSFLRNEWLSAIDPPYTITWEELDAPEIDAPEIINSENGVIDATADSLSSGTYRVQANLTISNVLDDPHHPMMAEGLINITNSMAYHTSGIGSDEAIFAELVSGNYQNGGPEQMDEIINVLFLPDGFLASQEDSFNRLTSQLVDGLTSGHLTTPFNFLDGKINFWRAFVPSRQAGASHSCEFYLKEGRRGHTVCKVPSARDPESHDVADWSIENLIWHVGLPIFSQKSQTIDTIGQHWADTTRLTVEQIEQIPNGLIENWKELGSRRPLFDRDTFWGLKVYDFPTVALNSSRNDIDTSLDNWQDQDLNGFLGNLIDRSGHALGNHFISTAHEGSLAGKDIYRLIFVTPALGATIGISGFTLPTMSTFRPFPFSGTEDSFVGGAYIEWPEAAFQFHRHQVATLAFGLGRTLGLGVEHGESPSDPNYCGRSIVDDSVFHWGRSYYDPNPPPPPDEVIDPELGPLDATEEWRQTFCDGYGNLMRVDDLLQGDSLQENNIKWRYHRIKKCALLSEAPERNGDDGLTCFVRSGSTTVFAENEAVYVRRRTLNQPVHDIIRTDGYQPLVLGPLVVADSDGDRITLSGLSSLPENSRALIERLTAEEDESQARILLYSPVLCGDDNSHAELLSSRVRQHLNTRSMAINDPGASTGFDSEIVDCSPQQSTAGLPDDLVPSCSKRKPEIVALYSGGNGYHGHIYHPTARCLMRQPRRQYEVEGQEIELREFCAVCRYIIVDTIDPTKHPELDRIYRRRKINPDGNDND